jgi:hypothetical protein
VSGILPQPGINHVPVLDKQNTPEPEPSEEFSARNEAELSPQAVDKDALEAIDGAIDRLNHLGVAIR